MLKTQDVLVALVRNICLVCGSIDFAANVRFILGGLEVADVSLFDALLAPWVVAGVPSGALRALTKELRDKLGVLGARCGEPRFVVDDAIAAVEALRDKAGVDAREALTDTNSLASELRNAAAHGLKLANAWCASAGEPPLTEEVVAHFLARSDQSTLGIANADGWAEFLVQSRAVQIPVDGRFGPRLLRLVPGSVDDLGADAWVVSGTPWRKPDHEFNGRAHRALLDRFGGLEEPWQKILATGPESAFWPASIEDRSTRHGYAEFYRQCGVWHVEGPWGEKSTNTCRHLFYVRVFPLADARHGDNPAQQAVAAMMRGLFASIAAVGATCRGAPPTTVRMTLVGGRQREKGTENEMEAARRQHMGLLVTEACALLERSPVVQRLDVCFFEQGEKSNLKETWQRVLEERSEEPRVSGAPDEAAEILRRRCAKAIEELASVRSLDPLVKEALSGLRDCLERSPRPAARDLGFHSRRTVEALVAGLCRKYNQKPGDVLEKNIDLLRDRGKFSRWFLSYLQTLRVLGNESVHVSARHATPGELVLADEYVLLASMARVLTIARDAPP